MLANIRRERPECVYGSTGQTTTDDFFCLPWTPDSLYSICLLFWVVADCFLLHVRARMPIYIYTLQV